VAPRPVSTGFPGMVGGESTSRFSSIWTQATKLRDRRRVDRLQPDSRNLHVEACGIGDLRFKGHWLATTCRTPTTVRAIRPNRRARCAGSSELKTEFDQSTEELRRPERPDDLSRKRLCGTARPTSEAKARGGQLRGGIPRERAREAVRSTTLPTRRSRLVESVEEFKNVVMTDREFNRRRAPGVFCNTSDDKLISRCASTRSSF
jgi:hypothetical protein